MSNVCLLSDDPELKNQVMHIFQTFVQTGGEFELNIADELRNSASSAIFGNTYTCELVFNVPDESAA